MAFFIDVLFYTYIAFDHSLLLSPKVFWQLFTMFCTHFQRALQDLQYTRHTEQDENTPGGLNSPKLHWRDCLAGFLQASVLPAALLQGPKAWSLGEAITCCHQASFTGWNKMRLFTVEPQKKHSLPSLMNTALENRSLTGLSYERSRCSFHTDIVRWIFFCLYLKKVFFI